MSTSIQNRLMIGLVMVGTGMRPIASVCIRAPKE